MAYLEQIRVVGIKVETTQNTAATFTAADYCLAESGDPDPVYSLLPRNYRRQSLDSVASVLGSVWVDYKISLEAKGSGTAGTVYAPLSAALQAAGMSETVVAVTSVTHAPLSAPASASFFTIGKSVTIECYEGALTNAWKWIIKGAVATSCKLVCASGKLAMWEFNFRGLYTAPTNASTPATTYSTIIPPVVQSSALVAQSYSPVAQKFEIDFGLKATQRDDMNSAYGIKGFQVTDRSPVGMFNPELDLLSNQDFFAKALATTLGTGTFVLGTTAGNIVTINLAQMQYTDIAHVNRNGILCLDIKCQFNQNTGDDWISIVTT